MAATDNTDRIAFALESLNSIADAYAVVGYQSDSDADLKEGARLGSADAAWRLACNLMYYTPQDLVEGERYMRMAEAAGHVASWHSLGICIHQRLIVGTVEERDSYFRRAAAAGFEISMSILERIPDELHPISIPIPREPCPRELDIDQRQKVAQRIGFEMLSRDKISADDAATLIFGGDAGMTESFSSLANHKEIHAEVVKLLSNKAAVQRVHAECAPPNTTKLPWFNLGVQFYEDDTSERALMRASRTCERLERTLDEALRGGDREYLRKVLRCVADAFLMHTVLRIAMTAVSSKRALGFTIPVDLRSGCGIGALRDFVARPIRFSQLEKFDNNIDLNSTGPRAEAVRSAAIGGIPLVVAFCFANGEYCFVDISQTADRLGSSLVATDNDAMNFHSRRMGTDIKSCAHCMRDMPKGHGCARCKKSLYCTRDCQVADWPRHRKFCAEVA